MFYYKKVENLKLFFLEHKCMYNVCCVITVYIIIIVTYKISVLYYNKSLLMIMILL